MLLMEGRRDSLIELVRGKDADKSRGLESLYSKTSLIRTPTGPTKILQYMGRSYTSDVSKELRKNDRDQIPQRLIWFYENKQWFSLRRLIT